MGCGALNKEARRYPYDRSTLLNLSSLFVLILYLYMQASVGNTIGKDGDRMDAGDAPPPPAATVVPPPDKDQLDVTMANEVCV